MKSKTAALLQSLAESMPPEGAPPDGWICKRDIERAAGVAFSTAKKKYLDLIKEGWVEKAFKVDGHICNYISPPK